MPVDVQALGLIFMFSAHKLYGPNGVGVVGRGDILRTCHPLVVVI